MGDGWIIGTQNQPKLPNIELRSTRDLTNLNPHFGQVLLTSGEVNGAAADADAPESIDKDTPI